MSAKSLRSCSIGTGVLVVVGVIGSLAAPAGAGGLGACCFDDATCTPDLSQAECVAAGGNHQGAGSACDGCPVLGPCGFQITGPTVYRGNNELKEDTCDLSAGNDVQFEVTLPFTGSWTFSLCESNYDTWLGIGTTCCDDDVASNDDTPGCGQFPGVGLASSITVELTAGTYFVTVDAFNFSDDGDYVLEITLDCPESGSNGPIGDCNGNEIPDVCDIESGFSADCNANGIPDECDLADGTSEDCNENGIPDECDATCGADIVFILDTSGSMTMELDEVCNELIAGVLATLPDDIPGAVRTTVLGITDIAGPCLGGGDTVLDRLGAEVPGSPGACGPLLDDPESWGPAVAIVADRFAWSAGAVRFVVPISDEGSCEGNAGSTCDPEDTSAAENAGVVAVANQAIVIPVTGEGAPSCVVTIADTLGSDTTGVAFHRAALPSYAAIAPLVADAMATRVNAACEGLPKSCACPADTNDDGMVDFADLLNVLAGWGPCAEPCPPTCIGDIDQNCDVGFNDLLTVLSNWGPCTE